MQNRYYLFGDISIMSSFISGHRHFIGAQAVVELCKEFRDVGYKYGLLKEDVGVTTLDEFTQKIQEFHDWVQISEDDYNNLVDHAS